MMVIMFFNNGKAGQIVTNVVDNKIVNRQYKNNVLFYNGDVWLNKNISVSQLNQ